MRTRARGSKAYGRDGRFLRDVQRANGTREGGLFRSEERDLEFFGAGGSCTFIRGVRYIIVEEGCYLLMCE